MTHTIPKFLSNARPLTTREVQLIRGADPDWFGQVTRRWRVYRNDAGRVILDRPAHRDGLHGQFVCPVDLE